MALIKNVFLSQFLAMVILLSCDSKDQKEEKDSEKTTTAKVEPEKEEVLDGSQLSRRYCAGCHLYPSPELLDKTTWETYILPRMGNYFGLYESDTTREFLLEKGRPGELVERRQVFPKTATLDSSIFEKIKAYYIEEAPEKLDLPEYPKPIRGIPGFEVKIPPYRVKQPMTSMVKFGRNNRIHVGDAGRSLYSILDSEMTLLRSAPVPQGAVWVEEGNSTYVLAMGAFNPTDMDNGALLEMPNADITRARLLIDQLQRPVHVVAGDLDGDGEEEFVICEYGKHTGALAWYKKQANGEYLKRILKDIPGATKAYLEDMNGNGRLDIVSLFGQGDEGIFIFWNQGNGRFVEEPLVRFPPSYGSSYFHLFDFNEDGHLDIIYTAGDNADYDPVLKPYHGVRIYLNDGNNRFKEEFFYPMHGAYMAIPHDFDGDGNMDIAAISFFPDFENGADLGFVLLKNQGQMEFQPYTFEEVQDGRWIVMDVGDVDGDGDLDLILGGMVFGTDYQAAFDRWMDKGIPYLILENKAAN
ncbi:FG-GAP repeat domain-containing protein [Pleomorphovibrio marinus]|uniref:FG-GAP repeat domain-containing protein n=1 Tax=Pleomorphovibrio marinus TaxID=2164132 RepID=UPI001E46113E|nr:VCBS repeat-containing protein [Pleomorphovibrio marinus]